MSYNYNTLLDAMGKLSTPYATLEKYEYDALMEAARESGATALNIREMLKTEREYGYPHFKYIPGRDYYRDEYYEVMGYYSAPSGYNSGGGCYLTTACMKYLQKENFNDKACFPLAVLRRFRDEYMKLNYPDEVEEYYEFAPRLVEAINGRGDADQIYDGIYRNMVQASVDAVLDMRQEDARKIYVNYSRKMRKDYLKDSEGGRE